MERGPRLPGYLVRLSAVSLCARRACKFVQLQWQTLEKRATEAHCWRPPAAFHTRPCPFQRPIPFESVSIIFLFLHTIERFGSWFEFYVLSVPGRILIYMMNDNEQGFVYYFVSGIKFSAFEFFTPFIGGLFL